MIVYPGKFVGVTRRDDELLFVLAQTSQRGMKLDAWGRLPIANPASNDSPIQGCKIIYGIEKSHYQQRTLPSLLSGAEIDPNHIYWELARCYTEPVEKFSFTFMKLSNGNGLPVTKTLSTRLQHVTEVGEFFTEHSLVLDKLMFEPEALHLATRKMATAARTAVILMERGCVHLQVYRGSQLVAFQTISATNCTTQSEYRKLADEIGVILLGIPLGWQQNRDLDLVLIGDLASAEIENHLTATLPYNLHVRRISPTIFPVTATEDFTEEFGTYFLPLSLAYLYYKQQVCELSQERNEAWSSER